METIGTYFQNRKVFLAEKYHKALLDFLKGKYPDIPEFQCNEFVGLELEIENVTVDANIGLNQIFPVTVFNIKEDGSLRNNGLEFCTKPIKGSLVPYVVAGLKDSLNKDIEFTERTSVHVHLNMMDTTVEEMLKVVLVYLSVERLLYRYVKKVNKIERANNIFCIPINQTNFHRYVGQYIQAVLAAVNDEDDTLAYRALVKFIEVWQKYTGLNLLRLPDLGTIEFRQLSGTCDWETITNWVGLITQIKKYATGVSLDLLRDTLLQLNTNSAYEVYVSRVFENYSKLVYTSNYQKHLEPSTMFIKECFATKSSDKFYEGLDSLSFGRFSKSGLYKALLGFGISFTSSDGDKGNVNKKPKKKNIIPNNLEDFLNEIQPLRR